MEDDEDKTTAFLAGNFNVWGSALKALSFLGYEVIQQFQPDVDEDEEGNIPLQEPDHEIGTAFWDARRGHVLLRADTPLELLGMAQLVELKAPPDPAPSYWWYLEGSAEIREEVWTRSLEIYHDDYFARLREADPATWRDQMAQALACKPEEADTPWEWLCVSKAYFEAAQQDPEFPHGSPS